MDREACKWNEPSPATVYLSLGGNKENSLELIERALGEVAFLAEKNTFKSSPFYYTSPVGEENQNSFINAVCLFQTSLSSKELLQKTQLIERELGKVPKPKWAPRSIDIDILFYGDQSYVDDELEIPHPSWKERLFVLIPLLDLTPVIRIQKEALLECYDLKELIHTVLAQSKQWVMPLEKKIFIH